MFMQDFSRHITDTATAVYPQNCAPSPVTTGLVAGTLVETKAGWQKVETLRLGDFVQTLDGGLARVLGLDPVSYTHLDVYKRQGAPAAGRSDRRHQGPHQSRHAARRPAVISSW